MNKERTPFNGVSTFLIFIILGLVVWGLITVFQQQPAFTKFSDFQRELEQGRIQSVSLIEGPSYTDITYVKKGTTVAYRTRGRVTDVFTEEIRKNVNDVDYPTPTLWSTGLTSVFGILFVLGLVFAVWYFLFRQAQNTGAQAFAFGKSRAKLLIDNKPKTTFDEVAGLDEAKEELREVIEFLRSTEKFRRVGARIPKGVLLIGPPGCGKTLLARAVAGEAAVPFVHISGSEFVELFVGVGASRVRDLFTTAEKNAPCVVFIDEIDAVGRQRGAGLGGGHDEREQTLNQLLVEMDGFDTNVGVVILAATNRPDILDPALLRPGRFDRRVVIDRPDQKGRLDILKVHSRNVPLGPDVDLQLLAQRTPGFTGADLANMVNEAAILAARENKLKVDLRHFEEAIERVIAGPQRKSRIIGEKEREIIAFHESGHALLGWVLPFADKVHKISILPRGLALGYTLQLPEQDKYLMTKNELLDKMTVLLGGRVAEEIIFDEVSTGAQNDLEELTELARRMVKEFGMSVRLGPITFGKRYGSVFLGRDIATERDYSEDTAEQIDQEVHSIVQAVYERARGIIARFKEALKKIAHQLMERENIEKDEFTKMMTELGVPANSERNAFVPEVSA